MCKYSLSSDYSSSPWDGSKSNYFKVKSGPVHYQPCAQKAWKHYRAVPPFFNRFFKFPVPTHIQYFERDNVKGSPFWKWFSSQRMRLIGICYNDMSSYKRLDVIWFLNIVANKTCHCAWYIIRVGSAKMIRVFHWNIKSIHTISCHRPWNSFLWVT